MIQINSRFDSNPYFEKWKRGRPSKAAKEKRRLSELWMAVYRKKYPTYGMLYSLLSEKDIPFKTINGEVRVKYTPRNI